ncbi:hypothetical protein MJO28_000194 [Puccinia striiformis f. sp. tritici]|uniref:Uncharacterized protein n=1 Tax=Puccinia striiformis f. sp. tritici TaxID=168172 RepID=A0ACC0EWQ5_9BASI|nr:hypothetical protein Pst134EA_001020 [Puccinia striiformis f. sp. tritici]KAH9473965.1 hypothetical protein Pst134EA_001020 [Puccinia striiformis f. sp. tritici]KAI7962100.1 hypothetical protein MJO28_000194 [Puccinia striiformis f. sp. tritici]
MAATAKLQTFFSNIELTSYPGPQSSYQKLARQQTMTTIDSLPYYDRDLDVIPNLRQRIEREIELELKSTPPPPTSNLDQTTTHHPFLSEFPNLLASSARPSRLADRSDPNYQSNGSTDSLDIERFNIPYPDDHTSLEEWEKALSNAKSQLEHQRLRLINLDLIGKHGANHWKLSNFLVDQEISKVDKLVALCKDEIDDVNRRRKAHQTDVGDRLTDLAQKWQNLISTNISLEITNINLKMEVEALQQEAATLKQKLET